LSSIEIGDIVTFKRIRKISLEDFVSRKDYSKYMLVVEIIENFKGTKHSKGAVKVLCANGEVNWVSINSIERT
jgi:hypothetical protein